jgi:hypothetical protein
MANNYAPSGAKHREYELGWFDLADSIDADRKALLEMAKSLERAVVQIERSRKLIAESRDLLAGTDPKITDK